MGAFDERSLDALEWNLTGVISGRHAGCGWIERPGGTATATDQDPWPGLPRNSSRRKRSAECDHRGFRQQGSHPKHSSCSGDSSSSGDSSCSDDSCTSSGTRPPFGSRSTGSSGTAHTGAANSSDGPDNRGTEGNPGTSQAASYAAPPATTCTGGRSDTLAEAGRRNCPSRAQTGKDRQPGSC